MVFAQEIPKYIIDKDGDRIIILDKNTREKLEEKTEIAPRNVYDNQNDLNQYKHSLEKEILSLEKENFSYYTLEKDETLDSLAIILYGDKLMAEEIQLLNEAKIKSEIIKAKTVIKYRVKKTKEK